MGAGDCSLIEWLCSVAMSCACVLPCRMIQAAENEVAEMAREAARADAMARAARKAEMGEAQQLELQRLKVGFQLLGSDGSHWCAVHGGCEAEVGEAQQQLELHKCVFCSAAGRPNTWPCSTTLCQMTTASPRSPPTG